MPTIQEKLTEKIPLLRKKIQDIAKTYGQKVVSQVTVEQLLGGMRGVKALICDTSLVEPDTGLVVRGIPIMKLSDKLPEEILYLLLTGELPDKESITSLQSDLKKRRGVPSYVWDVLEAMPADSHPMTMFSTAMLIMEKESIFKKKYNEGLKKMNTGNQC